MSDLEAKLMAAIDKKINDAAVSLLTKVQAKTPVDSGDARRSWVLSKVSTAHYRVENQQPYIKVLEYGLYPNPPKGGKGKTVNGFSTQAPRGMVRISIEEVKNEFK